MPKIVFLDRDGVINKMIYHKEFGIMDSPFTVDQFELMPGIGNFINKLHGAGWLVAIVSNQPGIAKDHFTAETFRQITQKMTRELALTNSYVDFERYCLHHPQAVINSFREDCACRKPKPGMILDILQKYIVPAKDCWVVGDGLVDVQAGKRLNIRTILLGQPKCDLCKLMDNPEVKPDFICKDFDEVLDVISQNSK